MKLIVFEFYHVPALRWVFGLQLDQPSQLFDYLPYPSSQHFEHDLDYHIFQLQIPLNVCAHIPLMLHVSTFYVVPTTMST
jgi:hypothetical protein